MDALIVYPQNKEQLVALKAVMKAMKIKFEQQADIYPKHVIEGVKKSIKQVDANEITPYKGIREMLDM